MKKTFYYIFVGPELHDAIEDAINGDKKAYRKIEKLCREKLHLLKDYYGNITPLHKCLIYKQDALTALLLRYSANPNDEYRIATHQGKPLQEYINRNDFSMIQLLAIYGANEENITFPNQEHATHQAYLSGKEIFDMKQKLKSKIDLLANTTNLINEDLLDTIKNDCKELQNKFVALASEESNIAIQNHYSEEAERFRQLPDLLMEKHIKPRNKQTHSIFTACLSKSKFSLYDELTLQSAPLLLNTQQTNTSIKKYQ